jgi:hypothetical protein
MLMLARIIRFVGLVVAAILVAGILLIVLEAKPSNSIVEAVTDAAKWLAGPFHDLFSLDKRKTRIAVNWGIAAAVYFFVAALVASLLARGSAAGRSRWRRRRTSA